ncbi:protein FAM131C [Lepisosteus oculatus]|uniref:protein FAM131C n=1 Tax=Lepisosteus oculatus TaxID=7918 RepID=UPI00074016DA|nr:PREDICTED: protein FAM131C [Lepisosteus oculatus]XP_015192801.1 PREDICTED: protein FAM131C [Lepisosteus oculatus]
MGACVQKEHYSAPQPPSTELQQWPSYSEDQPIVKNCLKPANGTVSELKSSPGYSIADLATSSLMGLVATIKDHITKPTAMAQGRVAHLIEWKGWSSGQQGWGGTIQQDDEQYSDLTDELKEARFAAGVVEQFALAEASLSAWSSMEMAEEPNGSAAVLQDRPFLPQFLADGSQRLYSSTLDSSNDISPFTPPSSLQLRPQARPEEEGFPRDTPLEPAALACFSFPGEGEQVAERPLLLRRSSRGEPLTHRDKSLRHADSSSLSEDEVFYN